MHLDRSPNGLAGQGVQFRVWFRADAHPKSSSKADDGFVRIRSVPTLRRPGQPRLPHPRSSLLSDPRPWSGLSARARGRPQTWGTKIMSARGPVPTIRTRYSEAQGSGLGVTAAWRFSLLGLQLDPGPLGTLSAPWGLGGSSTSPPAAGVGRPVICGDTSAPDLPRARTREGGGRIS